MRNKYIQHFEDAQIAGKEIPQFKAGDTLRVEIKQESKILKEFVSHFVAQGQARLLRFAKSVQMV